MRSLNVHSADALVTRWKTVAHRLDLQAEGYDQTTESGWHMAKMLNEAAKVYRVCASELAALTAASMELEAAHHGEREDITSGNVWPDAQ